MALRKRAPAADNGIPVELFDLDDPAWETEEAYRAWLSQHGLTEKRESEGPVSRHHAAAVSYAISLGHFRTYGGASYDHADLSLLSAQGVPIYKRRSENSASARLERIMKESKA